MKWLLPALAAALATAKEVATFHYESETESLMNILINSLYVDKDIFLRELLSNAFDAIERHKEAEVRALRSPGDYGIGVVVDDRKDRLLIVDNGIGMCRHELKDRLGVIASSAARRFKEQSTMIGQFGVGFYSSFLVADRVTVHSKCEAEPEPNQWISVDRQVYNITSGSDIGLIEGHGTVIELKIKKPLCDKYLDLANLKRIIGLYDKFISYPVFLGRFESLRQGDAWHEGLTKLEFGDPIWLRNNVTDNEYHQFFKNNWKQTAPPITYSRFEADLTGTSFTGLIYLPVRGKNDVFNDIDRVADNNFQLYVKRVLVLNAAQEVNKAHPDDHANLNPAALANPFVPSWLNFLYGIVDADNLPLKVDRQSLTDSRILGGIRSKVVSKAFEMFERLKKRAPEDYLKFWQGYHKNFALGCTYEKSKALRRKILQLYAVDCAFGDEIEHVFGESQRITFDQYIAYMKDNWKGPEPFSLYYLPTSAAKAVSSPFLELFGEYRVPVLLLGENPLDEGCISEAEEYKSYKFKNVEADMISLQEVVAIKHFGDDDFSESAVLEAIAEKKKSLESKQYKQLVEAVGEALGPLIDVKISQRLIRSPVLVTTPANGLSSSLQRLVKANIGGVDESTVQALGQLKTLELNPEHPVIRALQTGREMQEDIRRLYQVGLLASGFELSDVRLVTDYMYAALAGASTDARDERDEL